jgi:D-3-phosphoglycerate dehydrogenase / 2-oxoglutarate reductase
MSNWKILLTDGLEENGKTILAAEGQVDDKKNISAEELLKVIGEYDAIIVRGRTKVTREVFSAAAKLKVVGRSGVGVDNIDLQSAREHKVTVVNAPIATTRAVAELVMGMIFALARELPRADQSMKQNQWLKKEFEGVELNGKTLGIFGIGRIGSSVAKMASSLGMKILAFDPILSPEAIQSAGGEVSNLDELLKKSDFITIHTPLTDSTRNMINSDMLAKMKDGVRIICAARGNIIDETALLAALNSGKVAGAALDVFAVEPPQDSQLAKHPRVIATPHIGGQTVEAQVRAANDISNEVLAALRGAPLHWKVA